MSEAITTPAPKGMRCSECLCCEAEIIEEFEGRKRRLCGPCDDGTHPAFSIQKPTPPERRIVVQGASMPPIPLPAPQPVITVHPHPTPAQAEKLAPLITAAVKMAETLPPAPKPRTAPLKEKPMTVSGKPFKKVATEEQIEQIRVADPQERAKTLAQRIGVKEHIVYFYRAKFNGGSAKAGAPAEPAYGAKQTIKRAPAAKPASTAIALTPPTFGASFQCRAVTVTVAEQAIDEWFAALSHAAKSNIFAMNFGRKFEAPVIDGAAR